MSIAVGRANEHDSRKLLPLIEDISIETGGRPRSRPKEVYADSAYDTFIVRAFLRRRGIKAQIPRRSRKRHPGRPPCFDEASYKRNRSGVERFFGWLKNFRKLEVRYERLASVFMGLVRMACCLILWRVSK